MRSAASCARVVGFCLVLVAASSWVATASAVDATGHWYLTIDGSSRPPAPMSVKQVGNVMMIAAHVGFPNASWGFRVRIDPSTGAFTSGGTTLACLSPPALDGVVAADGLSMTGTGLVRPTPFHGFCGEPGSFTFHASRSLCGNGTVDPGEACDPCIANCSGGGPCDDVVPPCQSGGTCDVFPVVCNDGNGCTSDVCDLALGVCEFEPFSCDDGQECSSDSCDPDAVGNPCRNAPAADVPLLDQRFSVVRQVLGEQCPDDPSARRTERRLQRRLAKAQKSAVRAARASRARGFDASLRRVDRHLDASQDLVLQAQPDRLNTCGESLAEALDDLRACVEFLPRPD